MVVQDKRVVVQYEQAPESKENMVLESQVEIVVEGEQDSSEESEDGWEADGEDDDEYFGGGGDGCDDEEIGRGRMGMSLRRERQCEMREM